MADRVPVPLEEQRRRITAICAGERWILDTAYGQWVEVVLPRTELKHGVVLARILPRFNHRVALPVVRPQAGPDAGLGRKPR